MVILGQLVMGLVWCEHNTAGSRCYTGDMRVGKQWDCSVLAAEFDMNLRFKLSLELKKMLMEELFLINLKFLKKRIQMTICFLIKKSKLYWFHNRKMWKH